MTNLSLVLARANGIISSGTNTRHRCGLHCFINSLSMSILEVGSATNLHLGFQRSRQSFHSYSDKDEIFAELGAPVRVDKIPKLMTEKPKMFKKQKTDPTRKASSPTNSTSERCQNLIVSPRLTHIFRNHNDVSKPTPNSKAGSNSIHNFNHLKSIVVQNVPDIISSSHLKEAFSIFGGISSFSKTRGQDLSYYTLEFENIQSYKNAVSIGGIWVKSLHLSIQPLLNSLSPISIRIFNVSSKTCDPIIHSRCMSCGPLEGMIRIEEDVVDVLFNVKDISDTQIILERLNSTRMDNCQWSARVQQINSAYMDVKNDDASHHNFGSEFTSRIENLRNKIHMMKVDALDLESLHRSIMLLESHSESMNNSG